MKAEIKQILKELIEILEEGQLNITDAELVDFSLRIYNTNQINNKNYLKNELPKEDILATPQQKFYLKTNKISFPEDLTKQEAFLLIKKNKEK